MDSSSGAWRNFRKCNLLYIGSVNQSPDTAPRHQRVTTSNPYKDFLLLPFKGAVLCRETPLSRGSVSSRSSERNFSAHAANTGSPPPLPHLGSFKLAFKQEGNVCQFLCYKYAIPRVLCEDVHRVVHDLRLDEVRGTGRGHCMLASLPLSNYTHACAQGKSSKRPVHQENSNSTSAKRENTGRPATASPATL